ncbi:28301073-72a6-4a58-9c7e-5614e5c2a63a [Thermothielavioides terrestris]|uniref:Uncharacterized protein n=2 Tax=Thermothielavioides terrestris TaxID=2587410 RepID=G2R801_THETT|nr:uncharacterized protein THITE_2117388 [Thermothielavioides terrestris NRRL 8126]AEO68060.1 hypothetical protein THITE_2117388 [Thermothielavioides terrestris NRRL 8126]SPQ24697.1 28301073-72a6-4a58-9c7e-5614e5c2a63a [Thermothielavioides terrestris]
MKLIVASILALAATALAYPAVEEKAPVKRQNIVNDFDITTPAMTDAAGNVVPFEATKVHQDATAKGL